MSIKPRSWALSAAPRTDRYAITVPLRKAAITGRVLKIESWNEFKRSLGDEPAINHLVNLAADPFMREVLSAGPLGHILAEWLLYEVLPELMATGSYEADEGDWTFNVARCLVRARATNLPSIAEMH